MIRQPGTSTRWSEVRSNWRTRCGAASPMKASGPATATADAASSTTARPCGGADPGHRHAQCLRRIVAQGQGVECGGEGQREDQTDGQGRQYRVEHRQRALGQRTGQPEPGLVQRPLAGQHDRRRPGQQDELQHGAAQREAYRVEVAGAPGQGLGEQRGGRGAREGEPEVLHGPGQMQCVDRGDHREARARVDAEGGRRRERIAGDALDDRSGDPERRADDERHHGPRYPKSRHHQGVRPVGGTGQRVPHGGKRYGAGAEGEAQGGTDRQCTEPGHEQRDAPQGVSGGTRIGHRGCSGRWFGRRHVSLH